MPGVGLFGALAAGNLAAGLHAALRISARIAAAVGLLGLRLGRG
ncbi:hypothetical protein [Pseudonocardia kujensis]|nr:hypothetical protein [Pseudonocardia kujensis]